MSQEITNIKKRIKSISGALKVTNAMKLVSTVKLGKWKNKMLQNTLYFNEFENIINRVLNYSKLKNHPLISINEESKKKLFIVITSNLGLCGSYNNNIYDFVDKCISKNDDLIVFGYKGMQHFKNYSNLIKNDFDVSMTFLDTLEIKDFTKFVINEYVNRKYESIHLIYSSYKNSISFIPKDIQLLPIKRRENNSLNEDNYIYEPDIDSLEKELFPQFIEILISSKFLQAHVSEHASRCNAMENATDNANNLLEELSIEYNKARQTSITQEIIEVVSASTSN